MKRRMDFSDYEREPSTYVNGREKKGKWVYKGKYYSLGLTGKALLKAKWLLLLAFAAQTGLLVGMGLLPIAGGRLFYVLIPYVVMYLPALIGTLDGVMLLLSKEKMTKYDFEKNYGQMKTCAYALGVLVCVLVPAQIVSVCLNGFDMAEGGYIALALCVAAISFFSVRWVRKHPGGEAAA